MPFRTTFSVDAPDVSWRLVVVASVSGTTVRGRSSETQADRLGSSASRPSVAPTYSLGGWMGCHIGLHMDRPCQLHARWAFDSWVSLSVHLIEPTPNPRCRTPGSVFLSPGSVICPREAVVGRSARGVADRPVCGPILALLSLIFFCAHKYNRTCGTC